MVNQDRTTYIQSDHMVAGFAWLPTSTAKISVEGFYKLYQNYPFSLSDSISLANLGADFGVIGNEPVTSTSEGRSYGVEFLAQQKLTKGFYGILAYTFVRSEFKTKDGDYAPSSWDNQHIVSLTGGKRFGKGWYFEKWSLNLYLDIQNLYGYVAETPPVFTVQTDENDQPLVDPNDPSRYQYDILETSSGTVLPTLGVIVEF